MGKKVGNKCEGKEIARGIVYRLLEVNFGPETYVELVKWNTVYITVYVELRLKCSKT